MAKCVYSFVVTFETDKYVDEDDMKIAIESSEYFQIHMVDDAPDPEVMVKRVE